jgi:hypothetical protein
LNNIDGSANDWRMVFSTFWTRSLAKVGMGKPKVLLLGEIEQYVNILWQRTLQLNAVLYRVDILTYQIM